MGTPEFAVASLQALVEGGVNIVGVITAPDKPAGRGKKIMASVVKQYAEVKGLKILQPTNLKSPEFLEELRSLEADLQVVVAFRMLPELVWNMPPLGTFNLHASLLPDYRGAAPINWAIINGEVETGLTTFFLKHEIDTGDIIFQEKEPIHEEDNVGSLYERLMKKGGFLTLKTVKAIQQGNYTETPQSVSETVKHAPKIFKDTCEINWDQDHKRVYDFIRGLSPYPCAWTTLKGKTLKVFKSTISNEQLPVGKIVSDNKTYLRFGCQSGSLDILELQLEGKKRMPIDEFLKGYQI